MKKTITLKRDPSVELARIIGCMIVIGVHTILGPVVNDSYDRSRVFLSCILGDGVAIFWFIAGFFCFRSGYAKMLRRTARNIGIPLAVFTIIAFYLSDWILNGATISESITYTKEDYLNFIKTLLTWNSPYCSHLWYLYTYILVAMAYPVLKAFVDYLNEDEKTRWKIFIIVSMAVLILNDITSNKLCNFSLQSTTAALFPASLEVLYGYYLYKNRTYFFKKIYLIIAPAAFIILNYIRMIIQYNRYQSDPTNNWILFWFSSFGVLCAACVIVFCFSLVNQLSGMTLKRIICKVASYTLYIYLIHTHIIALLSKRAIPDKITAIFSGALRGAAFDIVYTIIIVLSVFMVSLACSWIIGIVINGIKRFFSFIKAIQE